MTCEDLKVCEMSFEAGTRYYLMTEGRWYETNLLGEVVSISASILDFAWSISLIFTSILIVTGLFLEVFRVFSAIIIYFIFGYPSPGGKFDAYIKFTSVLLSKIRKVVLYAGVFGVSAFFLSLWSNR